MSPWVFSVDLGRELGGAGGVAVVGERVRCEGGDEGRCRLAVSQTKTALSLGKRQQKKTEVVGKLGSADMLEQSGQCLWMAVAELCSLRLCVFPCERRLLSDPCGDLELSPHQYLSLLVAAAEGSCCPLVELSHLFLQPLSAVSE